MKTIIIYSSLEEDLLFSILEGDYSHLNKCFINSGLDTKKESEACKLLYDEEGNFRIPMSNDVSIIESKNWDKVAMIIFLP